MNSKMNFRRKIIVLSALIVFLALVYIASFVFEPGRQGRHSFAFLDSKLLPLADRIEILGSGGNTVLSLRNNTWVFSSAAAEYPVKQGRVDDFLKVLSGRDAYSLRAASSEANEKLGLVEGKASRIIIRGGAGLPLLDLLVGAGDALGRELYLRKAGAKEIYSGEDRFTLYTESRQSSWYDLRLFPAQNASGMEASMVQQAEISFPVIDANGFGVKQENYVLRRGSGGWIIAGNSNDTLDNIKTEAWLRSVLDAEGEDFGIEAPAAPEGRIILRFGDGSSRAMDAGPPDADKRRYVTVSNSSLVYVLAEWTYNRMFRDRDYFLKEPKN